MTTKQKEAADQEITKRLPEYGSAAIANLTDEDLKTLLRHVTREVAVRQQADRLVNQAQSLGMLPTKMQVTIQGPNLRDQSKGQLHVHAADCSDNKHYGPGKKNGGESHPWTVEVSCKRDAIEDIYGDHLAEQDPPQEHAEPGDQFWTDVYFAPCCADLPDLPPEVK